FRNIISFDVFPVDIEKGLINKEEIEEIISQIEKNNEKIYTCENKEERKGYILQGYELKDKLMQYTVSVGIYDINKGDLENTEKIEISKHRFIRKANCHYNEMGFQRLNKEDYDNCANSKKEKEEEFDSFI